MGGPDDGFFNAMDRFYGPIGARTAGNALYNHNRTHGGDVLQEIAPITEQEKRRVMHKSYSLDMFDEHPMQWLVNNSQGTLHTELQRLGVDTVVQVGAWTDDCIISTAFHAFSLQYDVVLVEDGVSTASKQHFNAIEVMRGAAAKVLFAKDVAEYVSRGLPVITPGIDATRRKVAGGRASAVEGAADASLFPALNALSSADPSALSSAGLMGSSMQILTMMLLAFVGPVSFAAGWILRGGRNVSRNVSTGCSDCYRMA